MLISLSSDAEKGALFLGDNGEIILFNPYGAGIRIGGGALNVPAIRTTSGTLNAILSTANSIDDLADVQITTPIQNGQFLKYDSSIGKWKNTF